MRNYGILSFFKWTEANGLKNLPSTDATTKEFTLDIIEGNLEKKEKTPAVDSLLDPSMAVMDLDTFILILPSPKC